MKQADRCNACGADLSSSALLEGYCPKCLLACALDDGDAVPPADPRTAPPTQTAASPSVAGPERIGPFRFLQKLGEGGMGEVFLAEQLEPVHRRVALKLIKPGMDSKQVLARFESERQALALMDHPSIAKVFDGGTTEQGRPYFAMEYIEGEPITCYCDRHRLSTRQRLELFMRVCEGVQHAHQKGVIHRDIKPSNVLVSIQDQKPVPRIIDFGVAKATQRRLTERTVFTRLGVLIGTPAYMSPEQAEMTGLNVDTRTDVYSLGVLLYELLVGQLPFDPERLRQASFDEIRREIREVEPPKPSTRISNLDEESSTAAARRRGVDPPTLRRQLRGDLDWITLTALEKDRARRYQSPSELAADVARHLAHLPVVARPPSTVYRARKYARRHRLGVTIAAVMVISGLGFVSMIAVQTRRASRQRDRANAAAAASERVSEFLASILGNIDQGRMGSVLRGSLTDRLGAVLQEAGEPESVIRSSLDTMDGWVGRAGAVDVMKQVLDREILGPAGERIDDDLSDDPLIAARLHHTLGTTYRMVGLPEQGLVQATTAMELRREILGRDAPDTLTSQRLVATLLRILGRYDEARDLYSDTIERQRRMLGEDDPATLLSIVDYSWLLIREWKPKEAEPLVQDALDRLRRTLGDENDQTLWTWATLGTIYHNQERYQEAADVTVQVVENWKRLFGRDHQRTLSGLSNLGRAYLALGRIDDALRVLEDAYEGNLRVRGDDHPSTANTKIMLGNCYLAKGRFGDAIQIFHGTHESLRRNVGMDASETLFSLRGLADAHRGSGDLERAASLAEECLRLTQRRWGDLNPRTFLALDLLARIEVERESADAAEMLLRKAVDARREGLGSRAPETLSALRRLATFHALRGNPAAARELTAELLESERIRAEGTDATTSDKILYARDLLTSVPEDLRDPARALELALATHETTGAGNVAVLDTLALAYYLNGQVDKAIDFQRRALALVPDGREPPYTLKEKHLPGREELAASLARYERAAMRHFETAD